MSISNRLNKHFVAAAAAVAVAGSANAAIVYSGAVNLVVTDANDGWYLNVETGAYTNNNDSGWDLNFYPGYWHNLTIWTDNWAGVQRVWGSPDNTHNNLAAGTAVSNMATFDGVSHSTVGNGPGEWTPNSTGFIGVEFRAADSLTHYGWVRMAIGANALDFTIVDFAYESTAGQYINTGQVPAPGALALIGLAGLCTRRRRN